MRAAIYVRLSKDEPSSTSCADQLDLCRRHAAQIGAHVVREFQDDGISGFSTGNRPGILDLLASARAREIDVVIAEHSDRLSRGLSGSGAVYEDLKSFGVRYLTVNQGVVTLAQAGLSGLVSAMTLEEGANKTRRGLRARVEAGRSGGGLTFGYRKLLAYDDAGEPRRGLMEIDPAQADVVRRILADYAAGVSPQAIAHTLNREGVPGPRGRAWNASTIGGNADRAVGIIHNDLYAGVRVWGRRTFVKDRITGQRRGLKAVGEPVRIDVPDLRIADPDLWQAVRDRYARVSTGPMGGGRPGHRRPVHLLTGLIVCACCDRPMRRSGPKQALRCVTRIETGACPNTRAPGYPAIEARVLTAIRENLLSPAAIALAIREVQAGLAAGRRDTSARQARASAELAEVKRRADRLLDQVADGVLTGAAVKDKLATLDVRRTALEAEIDAATAPHTAGPAAGAIPIGPVAAGMWQRYIEDLSTALADPEDLDTRQAREAVRALIAEVRLTPGGGRGEYSLEIVGDLAPILALKSPTNAKGPLAGAFDVAQVKRVVGAGTRASRSLGVSLPFRQVA